MRIKICGLFRDEDIDYVNESRPDFAGFVFAKSSRQVSAPLAQYLRFRLADGIIPVGVFVNAPIAFITELYHNGIISIAQLHGNEDESYIAQLKKLSKTNIRQTVIPPIKVIKTVIFGSKSLNSQLNSMSNLVDYFLIDSGAGSGKAFDWKKLSSVKFPNPWFLAGGINIENIEQAMALKPFAIDVSSGVETDGLKDRKKILELTETLRQGRLYER
ncbi:phosphoribosylanthranilate isomerase [Treponema sp. R80B11-R83G3]